MSALAKLADLKSNIGTTETTNDALMLLMLIRASDIFEEQAGVRSGSFRRVKTITEYPWEARESSARCRLASRPIESVSEVVQLYAVSTDTQFDAEVTAGGNLVENTDFVVLANEGVLVRVNSSWALRLRFVRIKYTAGWVNPSRIELALATGTWTAATKTLTQVGAFAAYVFAAGDYIVIESGTGATIGQYGIASRTSDDAIVLTESLAAGDLATGDITSIFAGTLLPPQNVQDAVLNQALQMYKFRDSAGVESVSLGSGGGFSVRGSKPHPRLVEVAKTFRRLGV